MNDSYDGSLPRTGAGRASSLVMTTIFSIARHLALETSSSGSSVTSMNSRRSAAWLMMYSSCSGTAAD